MASGWNGYVRLQCIYVVSGCCIRIRRWNAIFYFMWRAPKLHYYCDLYTLILLEISSRT